MKRLQQGLLLALTVIFLQSCGLLGISLHVHNPKRAGKLPEFSEEMVLLGEMTPYRSCFDVYYYDLAVALAPESKSLSGSVDIYAVAQTDFDTLQLDLDQNFSITSLIDRQQGAALSYRRKQRAIFIHSPRKKGEKFVISVAYAGQPMVAKKAPWKGGFVWKKDKQGRPFIGVACESDGASVWWPLKDHTADEPDSVSLHYTVPKELVAVGNGQFRGKEEAGGQATYHWFVSYPINTYNVSLYAGHYRLLSDAYTGISGKQLSMSHYVLDSSYNKASTHFKQLHGMLKVFEEKFGEYPWYADGFKLVESPYAGMEHQTAIAYGSGYKNSLNGHSDHIMLHETAHEWWGNSITARDLADVWLQEGFATYAEALYIEAVEGKDAARNHMWFSLLFLKNEYPVVGVKDRRWFHYRKGSDVYIKGAWILETLRDQLENDTLFFDILKTFAEQYKYQLVDSDDFIALVNQKTGSDYSWFFDVYLHNNQVPELEYAINQFGTMRYRWANMPEGFDKFKIRVTMADGQVISITPTSKKQAVKVFTSSTAGPIAIRRTSLVAMKENKRLFKSGL